MRVPINTNVPGRCAALLGLEMWLPDLGVPQAAVARQARFLPRPSAAFYTTQADALTSGECGARTRDLRHAMTLLSQLS